MKKTVSVILAAVLLSMILTLGINGSEANVNPATGEDGSAYSDEIFDYDFSDDVIIVTINKNYSEVNKVFEKEDFPGLDIAEIKDLTYFNCDYTKLENFNLESFQQILSIKLKTPGKQNVINGIKLLESNPIVECAFPDYLISIDDPIDLTVIPPDYAKDLYDIVIVGDINNDMQVTAADALCILQASVGKCVLDARQLLAADTDLNNVVNANDALIALQIAVNK